MKKIPIQKIAEIKFGSHFSVSIWFFPVALAALSGKYGHLFFSAFLMALLHEFAHILCAKRLGLSVLRVTVFPFGISAKLDNQYIQSSQKEFFIAFAGPLLSLILFGVFSVLESFLHYDLLKFCTDVNLSIALINLVPALPLDGGRMVKAILSQSIGTIRAYNIMLRLSRIFIFALGVFALYLFFASGFNLSLILISAFLFQNLGYEQRFVSHIALKEILESSKKLEHRNTYPSKVFCVSKNSRASSILKHLGYDYYCIFHVIDQNAKIIKTLTETQILAELTRSGIRTRFCDI